MLCPVLSEIQWLQYSPNACGTFYPSVTLVKTPHWFSVDCVDDEVLNHSLKLLQALSTINDKPAYCKTAASSLPV